MEKVTCLRCKSTDEYTVTVSGPHLKATCKKCGKYIKFLLQNEMRPELLALVVEKKLKTLDI